MNLLAPTFSTSDSLNSALIDECEGGIVNVNRQYLNKAMSILRARDREVTAYGPGGEYNNRLVRKPSVCSVWPVIAYTNWRGFRPIWDVGSYRE